MERRGVLSSYWLKRIAILSMLIDHIGGIVLGYNGILRAYMGEDGFVWIGEDTPFLVRHVFQLQQLCDILGRIAFPIFCFLIVQGFLHTRSREKYMLRLGVFALISEVPFDLAHFQRPFSLNLQNVMFTLLIGFAVLYLMEKVTQRYREDRVKTVALCALTVLCGGGLAYLIRSEYVFLGVGTMALMYLLRGNWMLQLLGLLPLAVVSPWCLLALIPLALYSGKRGRGSKYFFYVFYPAHFLALGALAEGLTRYLSAGS